MHRSIAARTAILPFALLLLGGCGQESQRDEAPPASVAAFAAQYEENDALAARVAAEWGGEAPTIAIYKTPQCGCCGAWVDHIQKAGFRTEVLNLNDLSGVKAEHGITRDLASCHTSVVAGYVVEGHVPADAIARMLRERPDIAGIALPGMPMGSPGMEGPFREQYQIIALGRDGSRSVWETRR